MRGGPTAIRLVEQTVVDPDCFERVVFVSALKTSGEGTYRCHRHRL